MQRENDMNRALILSFCLAAAWPAAAQQLPPIDMTKRADDVNKNILHPGTVATNTIAPALVPATRAVSTGQTTGTNRVATSRIAEPSVAKKSVEQPVVPKTNYDAKRAAESDARHIDNRVEMKKAQLPGEVIHVLTPPGEQELKQKLDPSRPANAQ